MPSSALAIPPATLELSEEKRLSQSKVIPLVKMCSVQWSGMKLVKLAYNVKIKLDSIFESQRLSYSEVKREFVTLWLLDCNMLKIIQNYIHRD